MPTGRTPPEVLRRQHAQMHQQLQAAGTRIIKLQERVAILEAENSVLKSTMQPPPAWSGDDWNGPDA